MCCALTANFVKIGRFQQIKTDLGVFGVEEFVFDIILRLESLLKKWQIQTDDQKTKSEIGVLARCFAQEAVGLMA